jgi:DNA-directed RNA polymerase specialized sigma24 family protein
VNGHLRRARRREERFEQVREALRREPAPLASCTPEEQLLLRRYAEAINQRLARVSRWQAEVFVMRHVEDLPIREIAQRTSRSSDSVRCSLYRVKKLLVDATLAGMVTARS